MKRLVLITIMLFVASSAYALKYRVEIDTSFTNKEDAVALMNYVEKIKDKAVSVEPTVKSEPTLSMPKTARMYECRHDEIPPQQCGNYEYVDFTTVEKVWK